MLSEMVSTDAEERGSRRYRCPYYERRSTSPRGLHFHMKLIHRERLEEFEAEYDKAASRVKTDWG